MWKTVINFWTRLEGELTSHNMTSHNALPLGTAVMAIQNLDRHHLCNFSLALSLLGWHQAHVCELTFLFCIKTLIRLRPVSREERDLGKYTLHMRSLSACDRCDIPQPRKRMKMTGERTIDGMWW